MIPQQAIMDFVDRYREQFDPIQPSFFEWTVALAFHWFREEKTDIAVIETGLGGRLDSTNVVMPAVSVITNIGWDHADLLGNSLEAIAGEKAGIIKPHVPVVIGEAIGSIAEVFTRKASEENAPITFVDQEADQPFTLDLAGPHQHRNVRTAIAVIGILQQKGWTITDDHIARGLANVCANTGFAGRWQTIAQDPNVTEETLMRLSGHRNVKTLHRYLGWSANIKGIKESAEAAVNLLRGL